MMKLVWISVSMASGPFEALSCTVVNPGLSCPSSISLALRLCATWV